MKKESQRDVYEGELSCLDCANFKIKIKCLKRNNPNIGKKDWYLKFDCGRAYCTKNMLVGSEKINDNHDSRIEYIFYREIFGKINNGWVHPDWTFANVCPDFESMDD